MSDLSDKEQQSVRTVLRFLRVRVGSWASLAAALKVKPCSLEKVASRIPVSVAMAFRVARLVEVPLEELISGRWLPPGACPHCGHVTEEFSDDDTASDAKPRFAGVLKLVK
jgi:hypothetical protein